MEKEEEDEEKMKEVSATATAVVVSGTAIEVIQKIFTVDTAAFIQSHIFTRTISKTVSTSFLHESIHLFD